MLIDELIKVVEKDRECRKQTELYCFDRVCSECKNYVSPEKREEMYADIQMRLKQEKWARDKMEEMRVEEVD